MIMIDDGDDDDGHVADDNDYGDDDCGGNGNDANDIIGLHDTDHSLLSSVKRSKPSKQAYYLSN